MTLTELRYLVALAETGHFRRAAEQCNVSQPTLSIAIKKLEASERQLHYIYKTTEKGLRELNRQRELSDALMRREANSANSLKGAIQSVAGAYLGMMGVRPELHRSPR